MTVLLPRYRRLPARRHAPGWTVCTQCNATVDNAALVDIAKPGKSKGLSCCPECATRLTGGSHE
jgi:hypothetical protein